MTLFVDASVLVALIDGEPGSDELADRLDRHAARVTSGIAMWEAARAIGRAVEGGMIAGLAEVERYCAAYAIRLIAIGAEEAAEAVRAHARYGKGQHAAQLNMGDCFAYGCAVTNHARLLYKGDDFSKTDLA